MTAEDNEGNKLRIYCQIYKRVCKVRGGCIWVFSYMGDVDSWYGQVVDVRSWMFDEGSWRRSSRGCLMRVAVGRVVECSWTIVASS